MTEPVPIPILSKPGVMRDGTILGGGDFYIDSLHNRFNARGLPQKMGGYQEISQNISNVCRGINIFARNDLNYVHMGSRGNLERLTIQNSNGQATGVIDRTPSGFTNNVNNIWQLDAMYDSASAVVNLIAHAAPNLNDPSNETGGSIYYGDITTTAALTAIANPSSGAPAGGIAVLHPYLFYFGASGVIGWSVANTPADLAGAGSGAIRAAESKIVRGLPLRGGPGNSPSGLFWSLNELIRMSFIGGAPIFQADTLSSAISVISAAAIIEENGVYYWPGIDRFFMFNGVLRELPNPFNRDFFYNNLNYAYRSACFATKVPAHGEIWFCFPYGSATECTHAVIYNYRLSTWYDTLLPNGGRSSGVWAQAYRYPLMSGTQTVAAKSKLWQHEMTQYNEVLGDGTTNAIRANFETGEKSFALPDRGGRPSNKSMTVSLAEPDFVQTGEMSMQVRGRANCRAPTQTSDTYRFSATDATVDVDATSGAPEGEQTIGPKDTRRLLRFRFESNTAGGFYEAGNPLAHIKPGDGRITS